MSETIIPTAVLFAGLGLSALGMTVYRRLRSYRRGPGPMSSRPGAPEAEFSMVRYQPLFRLLSGSDATFLAQNRHCPKVAQRWERSQRRVIRLYLRDLAADFQALHRQARLLAAQSPDHSHLLLRLFKQQLEFWRAVLWIEIRLSAGGGASINPEALAAMIDTLHRELLRGRAAQDQPA